MTKKSILRRQQNRIENHYGLYALDYTEVGKCPACHQVELLDYASQGICKRTTCSRIAHADYKCSRKKEVNMIINLNDSITAKSCFNLSEF